jgi:hypothetical protein
MGRPKRVLPLSERKWDLFHILSFVVMFIIAFTIDIVSGTAPVGTRLADGSANWGVSMEHAERSVWQENKKEKFFVVFRSLTCNLGLRRCFIESSLIIAK